MLGTAFAAAAIAAGSWATAAQRHSALEPTRMALPEKSATTAPGPQALSTRADAANNYWAVAKSCYADGSLDLENGDIRQYGVSVEIEGDKATIHGLVDLYFDEVIQDFPIEGVYNSRRNSITISCTPYDPSNSVSDYVELADMKSASDGSDYTVVLFAGNMEGDQLSTIDNLVLKVSDDLSTIEAQTGFGAYAFDSEEQPLAFYDYYQPGVKMTLATPESGIDVSTSALDFNGLFVFKGVEVKQTFEIYNNSSVEADYTIESSTSQLVVSDPRGTIAPCSSKSVTVTLTALATGIFEGSLTISSSAAAEPIVVNVNVEVSEFPDYAKITCADSQPMEYGMSSLFPFVMSEFDGHTVAESTNNAAGSGTQSYFVCLVDIPKGKTGIFSWKAMQINHQPNSLVVFLDEHPMKYDYYLQTDSPSDLSGCIVVSEGEHQIAFNNQLIMDWTEYGNESHSYVWNLDLQYIDAKDNLGYVADNNVDFGTTYFDKLAVDMEAEAVILNAGTEDLKVNSITGNGNFNGTVPKYSVGPEEEIHVPLTWLAQGVGEDTGDVIISTTGGDFTFHCKGNAEKLPFNYSSIVDKGEFSFNTCVEWPFVMADNGKYAYNSTSMAEIGGITYCWIDASFEVPAGQVGILSWDALNSSEDLFMFMDIPSVISGTIITLDGQNEEMVGGVDTDCASLDMYTPDLLTFKEGRHIVRFNYKKTGNGEYWEKGDDCLKLFSIGLECKNIEDHKAAISAEKFNFGQPVYIGCAGHLPATIFNYTDESPELLSYECDGPFSVKSTGISQGNLNIMVEYIPDVKGEASSLLTIKTNLGDFTVECTGSSEESSIGKAIYYESFEYDFYDGWIIDDANNDDNKWMPTGDYAEILKQLKVDNYDGNNGLIILGYNPTNYQYYEVDDYAATPEIEIPEDGQTTLRFMLNNPNYGVPTMQILIGEGDDMANYEEVTTFTPQGPASWQPMLVDLTAYAGKKIRIAFHAKDIDQMLMIDDVLVATTGTVSVAELGADSVESYYSIDGIRLTEPINGINIVVTRHPDGTVTTTKRMIRK